MKSKRFLVLLLGLAVIGAVLWQWWQWRAARELPDGLIQANGRIEGDRDTVAPRFAGRVVELLAREGDALKRGQPVARLQDDRASARIDQARAALAAADAELDAARKGLALLKQRIPLQIDRTEADVAHAEAAVAAAKARAHQARKDAERFARLVRKGGVDRLRADQAQTAWEVAQADLATAMAALTQARKALAEARLGQREIATREAEVAAVAARRQRAEAALSEARVVLDDLTLRAPADGIVTTRIVERGEVVAPGAPLLTSVDLDRLYLKVYVSERLIGKLRLGEEARIYSDAFPGQPFSARVREIASRAQFTPKEVQTPDERVKLVYAVKLYLDENPDHRLTPGLPADAVIRWRDDVPWARPRW